MMSAFGRRCLFAIAVICCFAFHIAALFGAESEPNVLHFGHIGGRDSLYWISAEEFANRVAKVSGGRIKIALHPSSELGSDTAVLKKLLTGEADISVIATPMSSVATEFGVFEMPFLIRDRAHVKLFRKEIMEKFLEPAARRKGYHLLAMWELGFRHITNNKRPVDGPGSLKGLKLRVPKGEWRIKMFEAYGVEPVPMEFKDVYSGIEAGKIDGLETPLDLIYSAHIERVQKFLTLSYHLYSPAFVVMGQERYNQLPISVRAILDRVAVDMQDWVLDQGERLDSQLVEKMKAASLSVNESDRLAFTIQSLAIYREYTKEPVARSLVKLIFESDRAALPPQH
ncbi:MAG TPA: TRAP transporter substrate-binding protein [Hyphomicrobiales bacterium]|nr:TRAP transporter substrate-binding protein [Hyphomicrobiales bacterium]